MSGFVSAAKFVLVVSLFATVALVLWSLFNINGLTPIIDFLNGISSTVVWLMSFVYNNLNAYTAGGFYFVYLTAFSLVSLWLGFQATRVFVTGIRIVTNFILKQV